MKAQKRQLLGLARCRLASLGGLQHNCTPSRRSLELQAEAGVGETEPKAAPGLAATQGVFRPWTGIATHTSIPSIFQVGLEASRNTHTHTHMTKPTAVLLSYLVPFLFPNWLDLPLPFFFFKSTLLLVYFSLFPDKYKTGLNSQVIIKAKRFLKKHVN